jgi:pimeloyl-ACP methyl ester carboxylesterase
MTADSEGEARPDRAEDWRRRGKYFRWAPPGGNDDPVDVFHVEAGDPAAPVMVLIHGFPTCSIDWYDVVERFGDRFRLCTLDFPGYGFSDKPVGWGYSLFRDAALLDDYLGDIVGTRSAIILAHDRGTSVSLVHALDSLAGRTRTVVDRLILTNGNVYLPLSNLTEFQRLVLDPATAAEVMAAITPSMLAEGMGATTFSPPRPPDHPEVRALAATFAHADGIRVLHETIQYLVERSEHEVRWLEELSTTDLPTTVIWGVNDTVSPVRVAMVVWARFLMGKPGGNAFYVIPGANHYLQNDRPNALVAAVLHALAADTPSPPGAIGADRDSPVLVDCSRPRLPTAGELLSTAKRDGE